MACSTDGAPPGTAPAGGASAPPRPLLERVLHAELDALEAAYEAKVMTRTDLEETPPTRLRPLPEAAPAEDDPVTGTPEPDLPPEKVIPEDQDDAEDEEDAEDDGEPRDTGTSPTTEEAVQL